MAGTKEKKRGPKPLLRPLGANFRERLFQAMKRAGFVNEEGRIMYRDLAGRCGCTRQTIWQYFDEKRGERRTIDAVLLLRICDELSVTPYWLALSQGKMDDVPLTRRPMDTLRGLAPKKIREEVKT